MAILEIDDKLNELLEEELKKYSITKSKYLENLITNSTFAHKT